MEEIQDEFDVSVDGLPEPGRQTTGSGSVAIVDLPSVRVGAVKRTDRALLGQCALRVPSGSQLDAQRWVVGRILGRVVPRGVGEHASPAQRDVDAVVHVAVDPQRWLVPAR